MSTAISGVYPTAYHIDILTKPPPSDIPGRPVVYIRTLSLPNDQCAITAALTIEIGNSARARPVLVGASPVNGNTVRMRPVGSGKSRP